MKKARRPFPSGKRKPAEEFTTQVCSIMFVDVSGFSLSAGKEPQGVISQALHELLLFLIKTVREYGATSCKTLGDGIICAFTARSESPGRPHPRIAHECAVRIQEGNIKRCLDAYAKGRPVFPLRIGINTAEVGFAGFAGEGEGDIDLVGHGINYAKRLEEACDRHSILCGSTTYEALASLPNFEDRFTKRVLKVKHFPNRAFTAYDWNPFRESPAILLEAEQKFRDYLGLKREEPRHDVAPQGTIAVKGDNSHGILMDYSRNGLGMRLSEYFTRGVTLHVALESQDGMLPGECQERGLMPIEVEVRWARAEASGESFLHGTKIRNLSASQREALFDYLRRALAMGPQHIKLTKAG